MRWIRGIGLLWLGLAAGWVLAQDAPPPAKPVPPPLPLVRPNPARPLAPPASAPLLTPPEQTDPNALAFDSRLKAYDAKKGDTSAVFSFMVTNVSSKDVAVNAVHTSCGCTAAKLPSQPWLLKPGESGPVGVTVDLHGKMGTINKTATLYTTAGSFPLTVRVTIPAPDPSERRMGDRSRNLQIAAADRQAVFRNDCATCHVTPTVGKEGRALFEAACGVCHETPNRASMVPDLHNLKHPTDGPYWQQWIANGKPGTLMPAFALRNQGILSDGQINSLVEYLEGAFKLDAGLPLAAPTTTSSTPQPGPVAP